MSENRIREAAGVLPKHNKPVSNYKPNHNSGWAFSFKYFRQIEYFGLKDESSNWFAALLLRLQDISSKEINVFNTNLQEKEGYRYHLIDWNSRNIPIKRDDLNWIDENIIKNEVEFPFYQFQISKANGRVVGFWDVNQTIFHVVLLDPKHNIQPAGGKYNYRVDKTSVLPCKYTSLIAELDRLKSKKCFCEKCTFKAEISSLQHRFNVGNFVYFQLDDDYYQQFQDLTIDKSVSEIVELFILNNSD
ncbi:hypothetical protein HX021_13525 [Sphingobacterium sp. N143]|uniref:hypothetical protein n=1 Tax=Sphingobacterium sp. N143 TaxID=2746727 RepID=UPI002574D64E|nr:hypothetical protein [Sphingobacterium sp. N143]MDM1295303.1 hypothetical protein [Sphingobacterium sp. N143]